MPAHTKDERVKCLASRFDENPEDNQGRTFSQRHMLPEGTKWVFGTAKRVLKGLYFDLQCQFQYPPTKTPCTPKVLGEGACGLEGGMLMGWEGDEAFYIAFSSAPFLFSQGKGGFFSTRSAVPSTHRQKRRALPRFWGRGAVGWKGGCPWVEGGMKPSTLRFHQTPFFFDRGKGAVFSPAAKCPVPTNENANNAVQKRKNRIEHERITNRSRPRQQKVPSFHWALPGGRTLA